MEQGNTGNLSTQQINAINFLMGKGYSMRKAKRILGLTKKQPVRGMIKR